MLALPLLLFSRTSPLEAASLPPGFSETVLTDSLDAPTAMALAPDGRIFVCQQTGAVRVVKGGSLLATPFVSLSVDANGERGLLGVAVDPGFPATPFVYLYYTVPGAPAHNRISRFTASGDAAAPGSEVILLELDALSGATNHNGGAIHFGLDGKLYAGVGENARGSNAQSLGNLLGKILRINPDGTVPGDNPFFGTASGNNRAIWALGLRNPFTFAFNHSNGRVFVNDVGQGTWEEINDGVAGSNYGWPITEGPEPPGVAGVRYPVLSYPHDGATCAIAGGAFYDPATPTFPSDYSGAYFFADLCAGWIRRLTPDAATVTDFATGVVNPVDLAVGADGALYYLAYGSGTLARVQYTAPSVHFRSAGVYRAGTGAFYLRSVNTAGPNDIPAVQYGVPGDVPLVGDWNGDGITTVGVFRASEAAWYLRNSNVSGVADIPRFVFGLSGDVPVVGDWNGDGTDTVGVYRPSSSTFYLRNSNTTGVSDLPPIPYGIGGDVPVVGDWNGDGVTTIGVFRPTEAAWYLRNSNTTGVADTPRILYGIPGDVPVVGDWNGDGTETLGIVRDGIWYLRDANTTGVHTVPPFAYGVDSDRPVPGVWR